MAPTAGGERDWGAAFAEIEDGLSQDTALCRHGSGGDAHLIHKTPRGTWEDDAGLEVCAKAPLDVIGQGRLPDYVVHEPERDTP